MTSGASNAVEEIQRALRVKLESTVVQITDESSQHAGHAGARGGGGHYQVLIVSPLFDGRVLLERHKLVYSALEDLMQTQIHALKLKTLTPEEWEKKRSARA